MPKTEKTIDKPLLDGLTQAKKNARYYCVIAKGVDVVGLIVQKKLLSDGLVNKAKIDAKGTLTIQGVCRGEGGELLLEVLGEEPKISPRKIKEYIDAQTDLTVKPAWAVVTKFSEVLQDDPVVAPPGRPTSMPPTGNLQDRLRALLLRQKDVITRFPAQRDALLPLAQSAAALVTQGSADAPAALDKLEQALNLAETGGQVAPQRPAQGPPVGAAAQNPSQNQKRPSLFSRAASRLKSAVRDPDKAAAREEMRCSAALDTIGYAIDKLAQDTPQGTGPQVANFSTRQMQLQVELGRVTGGPQVDPDAIGTLRKGAEVLEREVGHYVDQSASCQQELHDFGERLSFARGKLKAERDLGVRDEMPPEHFQMLDTYEPLLAAAQADLDRATRDFNTTGDLGPPSRKALGSHDRTFQAVADVVGVPLKAAMQDRRLAILERAKSDPKSDAGRLAFGAGSPDLLDSVITMALDRQEKTGVDFRGLGRPGQPLSEEEVTGIYFYTRGDFEKMNGVLLFPDKYDKAEAAKIKVMNEFCQRGLAKLPDYPSLCYPVMRWESGDYDWESQFQEGQTFHNKQFWSTGSTTGVATKTPKGAILKFRIYGKTGKDIAIFSDKQGEGYKASAVPQPAALSKGEVLFAPGTPFRVMAVVQDTTATATLPVYNITLIEQ